MYACYLLCREGGCVTRGVYVAHRAVELATSLVGVAHTVAVVGYVTRRVYAVARFVAAVGYVTHRSLCSCTLCRGARYVITSMGITCFVLQCKVCLWERVRVCERVRKFSAETLRPHSPCC